VKSHSIIKNHIANKLTLKSLTSNFFNFKKERKIEFIDLARQRKSRNSNGVKLENLIDKNIQNVFKHGKYILGPEVNILEEKLRDFVGAKHCITVSSGTDALLIALMSLNIKNGDEIITTPFSFISTAEVIALLGAKPIFVDIDEKSYNIDSKKIESKITKKTKAILPVSLYGQPANFKAINKIGKKYKIPVIEDAAQSFGAAHNGAMSCNLSDIAATSFFPSKPFGCYGDGGACFTNNDDLAEKIRRISIHGQEKRYYHTEIGINGRLDSIQAAILLAKFEFYQIEIEKRSKLANLYNERLKSIGFHSTPFIYSENKSVYAQYTIQIQNRSDFQRELKTFGIPTAIHYPTILPLQPALNSLEENSEIESLYKNAYEASKKVISLPFHPWLKIHEIDYITKKIEIIVSNDKSFLT